MIIKYSILIVLIGLSVTQSVPDIEQTIEYDLSKSLSLDEAHLIVRNTNHSENVTLFGNTIACEGCDLQKMIVAVSHKNASRIINTKFAYQLELRLSSSNISILCQIASYKFDEHGTYVLDVMPHTSPTDACSIEQIGTLSNYWAPVIVGIVFIILYTILVQLSYNTRHSRHYDYFRTNILHQRLIDENLGSPSLGSPENIPQQQSINIVDEDVIRATTVTSKLPLASSTHMSNNKPNTRRVMPKRLRALDTFRGFSLMVMIFVNYGGGGYWFFDHSIWNGLTLADLVFPWFTWMMGVSIVLSQRSLRSKNVRKRNILLKICRRTIILFALGLSEQGNLRTFGNVRILGVLQRLATCYFFTAILVLIFEKKKKNNEQDTTTLPINNDAEQPIRIELFNSVCQYWAQWLCVILIITVWMLITFLLPIPNCPTGYLGPGGKHNHGQYWNCTGGAAGYIDRLILGTSHLYNEPTCKEIYSTKIPYDPEGILGILTGILLCYLGVQAGHSFIHCTRIRRVCAQWFMSSIICGGFGLGLSYGGHSDSWIPINKNLWSLTFVFTLASLAFMILTMLYLLVDVYQWFIGAPFLWLGMNSIIIYMCHGLFGNSFPVQIDAVNTHAAQLAVHLFGAFFWSVVAGVMYYKKFFVAI